MESFRSNLISRGISIDTSSLIEKSSRERTRTNYNTVWAKWAGWCHKQQVNPFNAALNEIIEFLTYMFKQNYQYRTINNQRSAISAYHPKIDDFPVGQHPLVFKLLAGIFNERPPQPRYQQTWDVTLVLDYFENLNDDNSLLSDKDLTEKLTMLLALASAGRSSEIDAFDIRFMNLFDEVVMFHLSRLTKNRKQGSPPLEVSLRCFPHNSNLCVISCPRVDRLRGDTCPYVCPQTGLN